MVGYRSRTGDLFAPAVALGRDRPGGVSSAELPRIPPGSAYGITLDQPAAVRLGVDSGVALHPWFVYEIAFHASAFVGMWFWMRHRPTAPGKTFTLYLAGYGTFGSMVEFVRGNEVVWEGLTPPQLFLLAAVPLIFARVAWQARKGVYQLERVQTT